MIYKNDDILNFENISCGLGTSYIGKNIIHFHTIDSTNNYAKSIANNASEGTIVISEEQSSGRGRLGKKWTSKAYEGIWMSLILKPNISLNKLSFLTICTLSFVFVQSISEPGNSRPFKCSWTVRFASS